MARRFSRKVTKKKIFKLTPKQAETIIQEEFVTKYGNRVQKKFIFKPQTPSEPTIDFEVKGNRKEAE